MIKNLSWDSIQFRFTYNESMKVESITSSVSSLALAFGEGSTEKAQMSRPFGVALLFAGVDKNGPRFDRVYISFISDNKIIQFILA